MLHLFKRVYLAVDETLDTARHRLVISQDYGVPMGAGFVTGGQLLKYTDSVDAVVGSGNDFSNYLEFFTYLNQQHDTLNDAVVVYADRDSFVKIGTNFFKALLPLATVQDIYRLLSCYTVKEHLLCNSADYGGMVQNYERMKSKTTITEAEVAAEFFANRVNPIDFYNFFAGMRSELSLELLAATYGYNGQCENEVSEVVKGFCIKHAYMSATEAKNHLVHTMTSEKTKRIFNLADRPAVEMINILKNAESTALLFDERVLPRDTGTVSLDASWRKLSTSEIVKLSRIALKVYRDLIGLPVNDSDETRIVNHGFFASFEDINNPTAWKNKLGLILDNLTSVATSAEKNKVNGIFLDYLTNARKTSRELLRPYVINGCT